MTVKEYVIQQFGALGIDLSEAELIDLCGERGELPYLEHKRDTQVAIVKYIPTLLARPNVSENGFSVSYNREGLKDFYTLRCKQLGIRNILKPKINFL